jgi:hypothetical protein
VKDDDDDYYYDENDDDFPCVMVIPEDGYYQ